MRDALRAHVVCLAAALPAALLPGALRYPTPMNTNAPRAPIPHSNPAPRRLHYRPPDGYVGDVHPFFHNGVTYLFYLKPPREPARNGIAGMVSALAISRNLRDWQEVTVTHQAELGRANDPMALEALSAPWWLVCIVQNRQTQRFHSFYGRRPGIYESVSDSLIPWQPLAINPVLPARLDRYREWRDPFVFWNAADGRYWMLLTTSLRGEPEDRGGAISYARSRDLLTWEFEGTLFHPGNVGSPECPEMFPMGGRWYLLASFLTGRGVGKTSYRFARQPTGPWETPCPDSLDGGDLCAGNTVFDGKRRLLLGWIPTYGGSEEERGQQWGGDLAFPRELFPLADGSLGTRLPADFSAAIRGERLFPLPDQERPEPVSGEWKFTEEEAGCRAPGGRALLPGVYSRADVETTLHLQGERAGIFVRNGDGSPGFQVAVAPTERRLLVQSEQPARTILAQLPLPLLPDAPLKLRVILEDDMAEVFLNDRYSLAARLSRPLDSARIGFIAEGSATFQHVRAYALRESHNK